MWRLAARRAPCVHRRLGAEANRQREAARHRLAQAEQVGPRHRRRGAGAVAAALRRRRLGRRDGLVRKPLTGAPKARVDLVVDQQRALGVAVGAQRTQPRRAGLADAAAPLDGLDDHRADAGGGERRQRQLPKVGEGGVAAELRGKGRAERRVVVVADGERAVRQPVVAAAEGEDAGTAGGECGRLQRRLHRVGARAAEDALWQRGRKGGEELESSTREPSANASPMAWINGRRSIRAPAAHTGADAWPSVATPKPLVRSTKTFPSTHSTFAPTARAHTIGSEAAAPNASARRARRAVIAGHSCSASREINACDRGPGIAVRR